MADMDMSHSLSSLPPLGEPPTVDLDLSLNSNYSASPGESPSGNATVSLPFFVGEHESILKSFENCSTSSFNHSILLNTNDYFQYGCLSCAIWKHICICRLCGMITWMYQDKEKSRLMKLLSTREIHISLTNYWGRYVSITIYQCIFFILYSSSFSLLHSFHFLALGGFARRTVSPLLHMVIISLRSVTSVYFCNCISAIVVILAHPSKTHGDESRPELVLKLTLSSLAISVLHIDPLPPPDAAPSPLGPMAAHFFSTVGPGHLAPTAFLQSRTVFNQACPHDHLRCTFICLLIPVVQGYAWSLDRAYYWIDFSFKA